MGGKLLLLFRIQKEQWKLEMTITVNSLLIGVMNLHRKMGCAFLLPKKVLRFGLKAVFMSTEIYTSRMGGFMMDTKTLWQEIPKNVFGFTITKIR